MKQMSRHDILFIRACKSNKANRRIDRLYAYLYLSNGVVEDKTTLINILAGVCERNLPPITYTQAIDMSNPDKWKLAWEKDVPVSPADTWFDSLVSKIRYTDITTLEGFIQPAYWRNRK